MTLNFLLVLVAHLALATAQDQTFSQRLLTRETSLAHRRDLGWGSFTRWVSDRWEDTVRVVEDVAEITGLDHVVHTFTGGDRIFNRDGSYNNELLENAVEDAVVFIEDVFSATGLDKLVHQWTGGCRVANRDGSYNNGCWEELQELALEIITGPFVDKAKEIWEDIQKGGDAVLDIIKDQSPTAQELNYLEDVMTGEKSLKDAQDRKELGELLENRILKVVDHIRYGVGLVDGQRPVVVFGTGFGCGGSYVVGAEGSLNMFRKIPLYPGDRDEVSITASAAVGIGGEVEVSCGQAYHFSFNTHPSDMAGLGVTVSITAVAYGGIKVDFGFAMSDDKRFKLATISISAAVVGAGAGVSVSFTHTSVVATLNNIPVNPVSEQVEKPATWCANEGGSCECDGFVRYGFGERWNVMDEAIDGSIGCNNGEFGDPFFGQKKICQCIPEIYGDHGFHFELRGDEGNEIVTITDGQSVRTRHLSTDWKTFSASNANIVIRFTNDQGSNDVFFRSTTRTNIRSDERFPGWNCGTSSENRRCQLVRDGGFYWKADYQITFIPECEMHINAARKTECAWGGVDSVGRASLGGGGHSTEACLARCIELGDACMFAAVSNIGYCHMFQTCDGQSGSTWTMYEKTCKSDRNAA